MAMHIKLRQAGVLWFSEVFVVVFCFLVFFKKDSIRR